MREAGIARAVAMARRLIAPHFASENIKSVSRVVRRPAAVGRSVALGRATNIGQSSAVSTTRTLKSTSSIKRIARATSKNHLPANTSIPVGKHLSPRVKNAMIQYQKALQQESQTYGQIDRQLKNTGRVVKVIGAGSGLVLGGAPGLSTVESLAVTHAAKQIGSSTGTLIYRSWQKKHPRGIGVAKN
jgi:hypothetical protein